LNAGHENSSAERLLNTSASPTRAPTLRTIRRGFDYAGDCHPEFHFLVSDGMSSDDHDAGLARLLGGAAQNLGQHLARQSRLRPAYDVQRGARRPAHRIDVRESALAAEICP